MTTLFNYLMFVKSKIDNKRGQGMVEYVLVIAFIAIVVIAGLTPLGGAIKDAFIRLGNNVTAATP